jgi:hypothetical protein
MDNDVWEEMDAKVASMILLNLSYEVIYNVIDVEKAESIWKKIGEFVYGEEFDE